MFSNKKQEKSCFLFENEFISLNQIKRLFHVPFMVYTMSSQPQLRAFHLDKIACKTMFFRTICFKFVDISFCRLYYAIKYKM